MNRKSGALPGWRTRLLASAAVVVSGLTLLAQSNDALLDKLVQKGILTRKEADELRLEETPPPSSRMSLAQWVEKVSFSGDLRVRLDSIHSAAPGFVVRDRYRFRARFGVTLDLAQDLEIGLRLTTGDDNPISQNVTFADNASKKEVRLNEAYLKYTPLHDGVWTGYVEAGKMRNPVEFPSSILYDRDYTPEGFAQSLTREVAPGQDLNLVLAQYVLDEIGGSNRNPWMFGGELRWDSEWSDRVTSSLGAAGFTIMNPDSLTVDRVPYVGQGNSRTPGGVLIEDYDIVYGEAEWTYTFDSGPLYSGRFPVYLFGNALYNLGAAEENLGYGLGFRVGRARRARQWELAYVWTHLEADAWWDQVVESDFGAVWSAAPPAGRTGYFSGTNIEGHWIRGTYAIFDQWSVSVACFVTSLIDNPMPEAATDTTRLFVETSLHY
ncbi:MAG: putative porin [Verrucomicrobiales bacterium]|nr:putative porin [Verrucomicrobiales bacterium]MCP5527834.1 putative porin [Verrucomicrobiales bacterium]